MLRQIQQVTSSMVKALSASFIEDMSNALVSEQAKLEKELAGFTHRNAKNPEALSADYPEVGTDEGENAAEVAQFSDNLSLEQELENALKDTKSALNAIAKGEYGTCKYCKQQIDEARLRIRPTSTSCVACKKTLTQEV